MSSITSNSSVLKFLNDLTPGLLPSDVFEAIARLVVVPTFVVVPLFIRNGKTRVLLTRRAADDIHYAGQLHPPGKVLLASDKDLGAVFVRLMKSELANISTTSRPVFVGHFFEDISRGKEIALVHYLEIDDPHGDIEIFDCDALPTDLIVTDRPRVESAVTAFDTIITGQTKVTGPKS